MDQSHLSAVSHHGRPDTPCSVNYVSANTDVWSRPKQFTTDDDAISPFTRLPPSAPATNTRSGRRVQLRAKARTAFKHAKRGLRIVGAYVRPGNHAITTATTSIADLKRAESRLSMHVRQSMIEPAVERASTPSVCLTKHTFKGTNVRLSIHQAATATQISLPSYRDTNVRLSIHQAASTPEVTQTFFFDVDSPESSDDEDDKRKSMRFQHPVVNGVIAGHGASNRDSSGEESIDEESPSVVAGTPTTIATMDFEDQVNPKLVYRHSRAVSDGQSFNAFKNVMDGVGVKPMPRASAQPPSLPYIPLAPAMQLHDDEDDASVKTVTPAAEKPVLAVEREVPTVKFADVVHPNTLAIGAGVPLSKPRTTIARPHTTGELTSSANHLPFLPFISPFNPYNRASTPTSSPPAAPSSSKASADGLAVAFAEVEAAEQVLRQKRHTTLYEEIEGGLLPPPLAAPAPVVHRIKRKALPTARTPEAVISEPVTDKPLPPVPAPDSPRRHTRGDLVPPALAMNDNGYPILERPSRSDQQPKQRSEKVKKEMGPKRTKSQTIRAFDKALARLW